MGCRVSFFKKDAASEVAKSRVGEVLCLIMSPHGTVALSVRGDNTLINRNSKWWTHPVASVASGLQSLTLCKFT